MARLSRPNLARRLALVATCPTCLKDRRVMEIQGDQAALAVCGHVIPRSDAR
jgi:hypothetical protein